MASLLLDRAPPAQLFPFHFFRVSCTHFYGNCVLAVLKQPYKGKQVPNGHKQTSQQHLTALTGPPCSCWRLAPHACLSSPPLPPALSHSVPIKRRHASRFHQQPLSFPVITPTTTTRLSPWGVSLKHDSQGLQLTWAQKWKPYKPSFRF